MITTTKDTRTSVITVPVSGGEEQSLRQMCELLKCEPAELLRFAALEPVRNGLIYENGQIDPDYQADVADALRELRELEAAN